MIDPAQEKLLFLSALGRTLMADDGGKPPGPGTLARWAQHGLRGVRLEIVRVGGRLASSREALARFFSAVEAARGGPSVEHAHQQKTPNTRETEEELDRLRL
jgi:hypothetical protein